MTTSDEPVELTVVETAGAEWQISPFEEINAEIPMIPLLDDPDTGMQVFR